MNMQGFQLVDPFAGLIFNGTLDRFPQVKLIMAEAGLAWVPHMIQSFDYFAKRLREGRVSVGDAELRMPEMKPSEYFPRSIYVTFQDDAAGMQMVGARHPDGMVLLEPERVMWASDYPHPASTWPDSQQVIEMTMRGVEPEVRQKVLVGNAIRLYELG
jgi:predicted TIM-barrel fold metal-dependent hydrolase